MNDLEKAFKSVNEEFSRYVLEPEIDKLPNWYTGQILRVGPAKFEYGDIHLNHWFDGLAMVYGFDYVKNNMFFTNKFLRSEQYLASTKGYMKYDEFGTRVSSKLSKIMAAIKTILGKQNEKPSCNVNILAIRNKILATSEVTTLIEFNSKDLNTISEFKFDDNLKGVFSCAHPQFDPETKEQFNFVVDIGKSCKYSIYRIAPDSLKREVLYQFYDNEFIYNHTLFLTENYVVLYLGPLRAKPLDFLSKPISEVISYSKDAKSKFLIIERKKLQVTILDGPSFVVLHGANAFEQDGIINLDLVEYIDNFEPYKKFYFENIKNNDCNLEMTVSRVKLNIANSKIDKTIITEKACEFPRINERFLTKPYQYIYLANRRENANFFNSIIKISLSDKSILEYDFGTDFVSEPIFIANPNSNQEDDGIIFVNVINITKKLSYIAYLNASDLSLIYKAYLPIQIPPTLHGIYLREL